jgi:exonuclease III
MATSATNIFNRLIQKRNVDILCLQETKLQEQHVAELDRYLRSVLDIHSIYWSCSTIKKGYSGTAIILLNTKYNQEIYNSINTEVKVSYNLDDDEVVNDEGRIITLECDKYSLINTYVQQSMRSFHILNFLTPSPFPS